MKLLKVHEIISFDQTDFAKEYISMTTALRASSSSKVRKKCGNSTTMFYSQNPCKTLQKILMLTLYGTTAEQIRKSKVPDSEGDKF